MTRPDGRAKDEMRAVKLTTGFTMYAEGSVLAEMGNTKVICTASVEEKVPPFLEGKGLACCLRLSDTITDAIPRLANIWLVRHWIYRISTG